MSGYPDQPFDAREERYFLAEILKASPLEPNVILEVIQRYGVQPQWENIALPNGRSLAACREAFQRLQAPLSSQKRPPPQPPPQQRPPPPPAQQQAQYFQPSGPYEPIAPAPRPGKRAYSDAGLPTPDRPLQPHFHSNIPSFASVNQPQGSFAMPSLGTPSGDPESASKKKRGRPTKAEAEQKAQQAAESGQIYPKPRKAKTPRASLEAGPLGASSPEAGAPEDTQSGTGTIRKRPKKPRIDDPTTTPTMGVSPQLGISGSTHRGVSGTFVPITDSQLQGPGPQSSFIAIQQPITRPGSTSLPSPARMEVSDPPQLRAIEPHPADPRLMEQRILPLPPQQSLQISQLSPRLPELPVTTSITTTNTPTA